MSVIKVSCKYFTTVLSATKKDSEIVEFQAGKTVQEFLDFMSAQYGDGFSRNIYAEGTMRGEKFRTPNIYLNKRRIQWVQDFPKGVQTIVGDGDEFWFGLIVGGGSR